MLLASFAVAGVLAAFTAFGPAPLRAADASLARAVSKAKAIGVVADPSGLCPQTVAAAARKVAAHRPLPKGATGSATTSQLVGKPPAWRCVSANGNFFLTAASPTQAILGGASKPNAPLQQDPKLPGVRIPSSLSLAGPLAAVALVLTLQRAALGLFLAVLIGAMAAFGPLSGLQLAASDVFLPTVTDSDNLLILAFTATMLGMVHVAMAGGGFRDLAWRIARNAGGQPDRARRRTRMATWLLGLCIFFDDYANSLVVGSSIRPLADRTGVSRAKLAYLVDATSAAVAGVAIVSTWVGFEVGLLDDQITRFAGLADTGYGVFLAALPLRFYCLLTVIFAGFIAWTGRDFGPMWREENQAQAAYDQPVAPEGRAHWLDAMGPVLAVLLSVLGLNLWFGRAHDGGLLAQFIAGAEAAGLKVLAAAGVFGSIAAVALSVGRRLLSVKAALHAWIAGVIAMTPVLAILICAMSMRVVCDQAGTPSYLAALLSGVGGAWVPLMSFFIAALVAFMTGSSWATMGILLPIVVPLAATAPGPDGIWLLAATAAVLDGAIFGDHCSPISDTTVMSSAASGCAHDVHVWTQLPYAATVMVVAALFGYVGTAWFGLSAPIALLLGALTLGATVRLLGRNQATQRG